MDRQKLVELSRDLRLRTLALHRQAGSGHIGCSLSCIELMAASLLLERRSGETFILSKGHAAMALYTCLRHSGELTDQDIAQVYLDGTRLPAHPAPLQWEGIPFALGSLGHGLPIATGIAKADQLAGKDACTFVLMSDGETNAGTTWETAHFAVRHGLDRLIVLVDRNGLQGFGRTSEVLGDTAAPGLWSQIGFEVHECSGHDLPQICLQLQAFRNSRNGHPKVLVGNTIKGCGVSYMEDRMEWHYLPMSDEQYRVAVQDVSARSLF